MTGCSVLVEGVFAETVEQNAAAAQPSAGRMVPFWLGSLPAALSRRAWRSLDSRKGALAAVANAAPWLTAADGLS